MYQIGTFFSFYVVILFYNFTEHVYPLFKAILLHECNLQIMSDGSCLCEPASLQGYFHIFMGKIVSAVNMYILLKDTMLLPKY